MSENKAADFIEFTVCFNKVPAKHYLSHNFEYWFKAPDLCSDESYCCLKKACVLKIGIFPDDSPKWDRIFIAYTSNFMGVFCQQLFLSNFQLSFSAGAFKL